MNTPAPTIIEFIRHGLPEGGTRFRGSGVDDPLSAQGWQQMWQSMGADLDWDIVISSPLRRCSAFARSFAQKIECECLIENDLREVDFGSWEGKTSQQLLQLDAKAYQRFYHNPVRYWPAQAEPLEHFYARVACVFDRLVETCPQQRVLVVAHAGVMRSVMRQVLQFPLETMYRISIPFARRLRLEPGPDTRLTLL